MLIDFWWTFFQCAAYYHSILFEEWSHHLTIQIMDWMEEFSTFLAPHADIFVASVKRGQRLKAINTQYDALYPTVSSKKAKSVDFDELTVTFYYNSQWALDLVIYPSKFTSCVISFILRYLYSEPYDFISITALASATVVFMIYTIDGTSWLTMLFEYYDQWYMNSVATALSK